MRGSHFFRFDGSSHFHTAAQAIRENGSVQTSSGCHVAAGRVWPLADDGFNSGERGRIPCRSTAAWLLSQGYEPMSGQFLIYF